MDYPLYTDPKVEKSFSSFGNYVVKLSDVTFRFFWKRADAAKWLVKYMQGKRA